ncbi:MAG: hypothetical protein JWM91_2494 [Rhodospirillales bacterium]|nr:hypothetical protein [Rhodospirillales bacterium]
MMLTLESQFAARSATAGASPIARGFIAAAAAVLGLFGSAREATAISAPITLGTASNYGVLTGDGDTLTLGGGFNLSGNVGIGKNSTVNLDGNNAIAGNTYEDSGITTNYNGGMTWLSGTIYTQSMAIAIADASAAATNAAALAANLSVTGNTINLSSSSITIKALTNLSENVLNISALSVANSTLTFDDNGFTGAKFIINVTGAFTVSSSGTGKSIIKGINGASGADILFNIEGSSGTVSITGNSTNQIIGTLLSPARSVTVGGGGSLAGNIIAGVKNISGGSTISDQSTGFNVNALAYVPRSVVKTPEPSSIALFGAGGLALLVVRRRRPTSR